MSTNLSLRITGWMEDNPEAYTIAEIAKATETSRDTVRKLMRALQASGDVEVSGPGGQQRYRLLPPSPFDCTDCPDDPRPHLHCPWGGMHKHYADGTDCPDDPRPHLHCPWGGMHKHYADDCQTLV